MIFADLNSKWSVMFPIGLYIFWLVTLWLGFKIGKQAGMRGVASRERKRLGIPF
jgi:hypothetical protein